MQMAKFTSFILLFLFFNPYLINSQEKHKNQFELLNSELLNVSEKFKTHFFFKKAISFFSQKEWDSTLIYSQKQILTSQVKPLQDFSHFLRGYSFNKKKIFREANAEYNLISKEFKLYNLVINYLGLLALEQNNFKKAIPYFKKLLQLSEKEYFYIEKNSVTSNLATCYLYIKKFKKSEDYFKRSYIDEKDTIKIIGAYVNIANLYYEQYKDDLAIPYFLKAYELAKKTNDFDLKRITSKNMSAVEENRKDFEKALTYKRDGKMEKLFK
jgi:tetratricopeptide (TPR) repeat protein